VNKTPGLTKTAWNGKRQKKRENGTGKEGKSEKVKGRKGKIRD